MTSSATSEHLARRFPQTRWSVVVAAAETASPESEAALESICRDYWYPLYAFARRSGRSAHDAQDLTQEFFRQLLEKGWLRSANRESGRLRTFLVVALKHFMSKEWRRASAQRRGGGRSPVQFDTDFAESRYAIDESNLSAGDTFDHEWAMTLLDLAMKRLREEFTAGGKESDFETLKRCLTAERGTINYGIIASQLGINEGAARVAVHRMRKRFRALYRDEISQTLADGEDLEEELRHLAAALARK